MQDGTLGFVPHPNHPLALAQVKVHVPLESVKCSVFEIGSGQPTIQAYPLAGVNVTVALLETVMLGPA